LRNLQLEMLGMCYVINRKNNMAKILKADTEYRTWLADLKLQIRQTQLRSALRVNAELMNLYWNLGKDIAEKQVNSKWGDGLIN